MQTTKSKPSETAKKAMLEKIKADVWIEAKHPLTTDELLLAEVLARVAQRIAAEDHE